MLGFLLYSLDTGALRVLPRFINILCTPEVKHTFITRLGLPFGTTVVYLERNSTVERTSNVQVWIRGIHVGTD